MEVWDLYSVKAIHARRFNSIQGRIEYKVEWQGFPPEQADWQPYESLKYLKEWVKELNEKGLPEEEFNAEEEERRVALWYERQALAKERILKEEEADKEVSPDRDNDESFTPVVKRRRIRKYRVTQKEERLESIKKNEQQPIKQRNPPSKRLPRLKKASTKLQQQRHLPVNKKEQQGCSQN